MSFLIIYDKQPQKFLNKLDKHISQRIIDKIDEIFLHTVILQNAKSIIGEHGVFRIRIGDYRALYRVNYRENKIIIIQIDKRSKVYD
ncbi:type II toxin-antitoxin system RelE/ParE family toxin [Candidatus Woesearchaeota archaeon]|nr:type II toxin-antitoxin system RelE/ParE family toxin [Candidatus Woesearchaeota archaeon]